MRQASRTFDLKQSYLLKTVESWATGLWKWLVTAHPDGAYAAGMLSIIAMPANASIEDRDENKKMVKNGWLLLRDLLL